MRIAIAKEIKNNEFRVGMTPAGVAELVRRGHQLSVESGAGAAIGLSDELYRHAGAAIISDVEQLWADAELIVKVKEPQAAERARLQPHHSLFTYLHLAADRPQLDELLASGATCIAYETVRDQHGRLPLLTPMSEVAGRMAIQAGAMALERSRGGRGVLLGGVPGAPRGKVLVIGGGVVGRNAVQMAVGLGAEVTVLDSNLDTLRQLDSHYQGRITTRYASRDLLHEQLADSDLVVGAVLVPGAAAPKLLTRADLALLPKGAVIVDVSIDQGGCCETSRPTTHAEPTYMVDGIVHYCVANMPGAVARTSTFALANATLPYLLRLADLGVMAALRGDSGLAAGLNIHRGQLCCPPVGQAFNLPSLTPAEALLHG